MDHDTGYTGQLLRRLTEEHHAILAALDLLIDSDTPDLAERRKAFAWIARAIRIQAEAEDRVLFPLLDGSHELGHHVREDEERFRAIDARLRRLERSDLLDVEELRSLRAMLVREFEDEERVVFPRAQMVLDPNSDETLLKYDQERAYLAGLMRD